MKIVVKNTKTRTTVEIVQVKNQNCTLIIQNGLLSVKEPGEDDHQHVQVDLTKQTIEVSQ